VPSRNPNPNTVNPKSHPNRSKPRRATRTKEGEKGKRETQRDYLAVVQNDTRGKEGQAEGHCSPGSGQRGTAARPLDGGAPPRWGARTPATAPLLHCFACSSLGAAVLKREERAVKRERAEEKVS